MLLLEAQGENIRGTAKEIVNIASQIVAEEGPAILMWALEASIQDYASQGNAFYNSRVKEMKAAAREYTRENSIYRQWAEAAELRFDAEASMYTESAHDMFTEYAQRKGEHKRVRLDTFKQAMAALYPSIRFGKSTTRPHPNKATVFGMGLPEVTDTIGNVVVFPTTAPTTATQP
jgi:hypothetical protein